jgi:hypothetical protein
MRQHANGANNANVCMYLIRPYQQGDPQGIPGSRVSKSSSTLLATWLACMHVEPSHGTGKLAMLVSTLERSRTPPANRFLASFRNSRTTIAAAAGATEATHRGSAQCTACAHSAGCNPLHHCSSWCIPRPPPHPPEAAHENAQRHRQLSCHGICIP